MLRKMEYITAAVKEPYPLYGQILEPVIENEEIKYICRMCDVSGEYFTRKYGCNQVRHLSAKELADDIFIYFSGEKESKDENIYSTEYLAWLNAEIKTQTDRMNDIHVAERTIIDPDYDNYTSMELAEIKHREEYSCCLAALKEIIESEIEAVYSADLRSF